ncbi:O-antigen ligase family protein [Pontibacter sp. FD36]|uniref:O-antigen ligase family protein n=1 Tax=Pontibacter sp. FD36 TaxID=2789860 RepID=UPI0018A95604|nr:O-antigen ligase family protein [Pontibacter sp. FD36]MBF8964588.1 O-antigen ligase family protein [Pontibacter sp. FD36]
MSLYNRISGVTQGVREDYLALLTYIYALLLPLPNNLKSPALILLAIIWLIQGIKTGFNLKDILRNRVFQLFLLLYFLYFISFLLSPNKESLDLLILQTSIPLLPLIFYQKLERKEIRYAVLCFAVSTFFVSIWALYKTYTVYFNSFDITYENLKTLNWAYFSFTLPISINFHAPYFGLYVGTAFVVTLHTVYQSELARLRWPLKVLMIIGIIYFLIFLAVLSSRTALFATIGVSSIVLTVHLILKKKIYLTVALVVIATLFSLTAYNTIPYLFAKMSSSAGHSERQILWTTALSVIKENPVWGVTTGERTKILQNKYEEINFESGIENNLNAHNQYLDIAVSLGIPGLVVLILCYSAIIQYASSHHNGLLLMFILIFSLCSVTESLLHRQFGVVLFSFFCAIFVFAEKPKPN